MVGPRSSRFRLIASRSNVRPVGAALPGTPFPPSAIPNCWFRPLSVEPSSPNDYLRTSPPNAYFCTEARTVKVSYRHEASMRGDLATFNRDEWRSGFMWRWEGFVSHREVRWRWEERLGFGLMVSEIRRFAFFGVYGGPGTESSSDGLVASICSSSWQLAIGLVANGRNTSSAGLNGAMQARRLTRASAGWSSVPRLLTAFERRELMPNPSLEWTATGKPAARAGQSSSSVARAKRLSRRPPSAQTLGAVACGVSAAFSGSSGWPMPRQGIVLPSFTGAPACAIQQWLSCRCAFATTESGMAA